MAYTKTDFRIYTAFWFFWRQQKLQLLCTVKLITSSSPRTARRCNAELFDNATPKLNLPAIYFRFDKPNCVSVSPL